MKKLSIKIPEVESLQSERLLLKQLNESNAELVLDYLKANQSHFKPWIPEYGNEYYSVSHQKQLLKAYNDKTQKGEMVKFWLFEANDFNDSRIIGDISFNNIVRGALQGCHVGYRMDKNYLNQGYMTEALSKAINFMFKVHQLHRIEANIMPFNQHSIELVEKLGFTKEGFSANYLKINGRWENHLRFALLNHELELDERGSSPIEPEIVVGE